MQTEIDPYLALLAMRNDRLSLRNRIRRVVRFVGRTALILAICIAPAPLTCGLEMAARLRNPSYPAQPTGQGRNEGWSALFGIWRFVEPEGDYGRAGATGKAK